MPDSDPSQDEPAKVTDRLAPKTPETEKDAEGADNEKDPKSATQKRKMTESLDEFLGSN